MATEDDVTEPVSLMERGVNRCLNTGELNQPPETVDYLVKGVASNVAVEIVHCSFEGNAGVIAGESFFESSSIAKVPDEETSTKQETCQADEISYQAEQTMLDKKQIKEEESLKAAEEIGTKEEVMNEINKRAKGDERSCEISHATGISLEVEKIEQPSLKIGEEETSKEEILFDKVETYKQGIVEQNQTNDSQKDGGEGRKSNKDAEPKTSNQAAILEASTGQDKESVDLSPDLTVHSLDIGVQTSTQSSVKIEAEDNRGHAETVTFEENNGEKISGVGEQEDSCPSFLDGENSPDVAKPIEKIESEEEDIRYNSIGEASVLATSPEIQRNTQKSSAIMEDGKDKLDSPSATLATDRSSEQEDRLEVGDKLEDTSNIKSTENQDASNSNKKTKDITTSLDGNEEKYFVVPSIIQTEHLCLQEVDKADISKVVSEALSEDIVKPQESTIEELKTKPEAERSGGEKVKGETTAEGKLENLSVKHEDVETNKDEGVTTSEASAVGNIDKSRDTVVEDEDNIRNAVTTPEYNQDGSRNEKNLPPTKLNEKTEIEEVEVQNKICGELDTTHSLIAEKELRQDSDFEPQDQIGEANGASKYEEKNNENDPQAPESTEKTILENTSAKEAVTTETEIDKSEKVQELNFDEQSEIKDAEMSIKEDAPKKEETSETQNYKLELTSDDTVKCHTEESTSEKLSSIDFLHETIEKNFQAESLHEAATASKDEEEDNEKTRSTINEEITGVNKVTEKNTGDNVTNLSSEIINKETVEGYQQIAKEADISEVEDTKEQSIEGNYIACISLEAVEESPAKNFKNDENNTESSSSREILMESETAETIDSITNEAKQSDEIDNSTIQCSLLQEQEILQSENISEGSSVEETNVDISSIKNDEDKENHTELPLAEVGEHKEILKGDQDLEQIMQKNESKENIEYPLNIKSAETDTGTLSQLEQRTLEERVESPQDNKTEAEKEKEENILNESNINGLPQEYIAQDPVNFLNDDSCTNKSSAGILEESKASGTCESFSNETNQNAESPIETIPPSLADTTAASEGFGAKDDTTIKNWEESSDKKDKEETSVDIDNIRNETVKLKNLPPRELNEKIESAEFETLDRNVNHSEAKELAKVIDFEPQDQVHEANRVGIDEVKNDETESQACQSTENTDLELLSAKGAENTEASLFTSETEIEKLEKIHESESKETVDRKVAEMNIGEDIENKEEACKKEIHKLATSDDSEKYHTENIASLHKTDEQKFQAATTLEGEENSRKTVSIINEEIMGIGEVADEENIKDNFRQLSSEVFNKDTAESYQQTEKETDVTKGSNTEEQVMEQNNAACTSQKSDEEEAVEISQNYEKNSGKPNSGEIFEESETAETVDGIASEAKQIDESPNSAPQCSQVKEHESSQSEYITICDGSSAEEIDVDGSSIKKEEDKEKYTGLVEVGEHSEELLEGEDVEEILQKDEPNENIEQLLNVISEETEAGASSQTDDNTVEETVESPLNNKRDAEKEKEDIINESSIKCLLLESVAKNDAKNFEKDENRAEKSNTEILEESEAVETGENITDETNQNDENPNATISSSLAKEVESLKCEDMANPEEASAEEKRKEQPSIKINDNIPMLEESNKEIDKATSETVHEMNQNEESPNSSLQASVVREDAKQILQKDEPKENNEQPHKTIEETVERPQDNEKGAKTTKEEDIRNESKTRSLSLESLAHDPLKNLENDGGSAEKSNTEIPKQSEAAETVEDITHETNQNDSPNETIPAPVAEDLESLQCEVKDIQAEDSPEEKKEEPSSIKISIDNDKITMLEEANKDSDQEKSKTVDYSAHKIMNQIDESLNSSIQAPVVREQETPQGDTLTPVEASPMDEKEENDSLIKKDEEKDNNVLSPGTELDALSEVVSNPREEIGESSQDNVKETEMPAEEDNSKEHTIGECNIKSPSKESVEERTNKNLQNDEDNAEMPNREIFESATGESIVLETNQNYENPNATIPTAPVKEEETLQGKGKNVNLAEILLDEKEDDDGSPIKAGEVNNSNAELAEAIKSREKEISHGEELIEPKIQNEPEEFLESSKDVITEESKAGMLNEKADDISIPKEVGAFQNSEETAEKETEEASKESIGDRTNKNFQNDKDDAEISNKEIFEEPATGETNESIALEKNQNYESPNATIPTAPVKEEETLQGEAKNVNLAETLSDENEDDGGSPIKASEVNDSNAELVEAINNREIEISHGKEIIEPKSQNEPEEFIELSRDVLTDESRAGMLNEKTDEISIPEEVGPFQNSEETVEKETEEASEESVEEGTNKNLQNDEDNTEKSNKEIFEESATGEIGESIALETKQNNESPSASIPTSSVKEEESLQGKGKNVNLTEALSEEKKEDDGSPFKATEVNDSNVELAVAIKNSEKEVSHGEEIIEPNLQNEHEEFLESSRDEKADDISIPEEDGAFKNSEETVEKEIGEASKESATGTNKNLQNDEDNAEMSNKEIFEESAAGETGESIALETNQNYESPNATIPTAPLKEEENQQRKVKNVNLAEALSEEKKEDDGSPIKANEINDSNAELAETIKKGEKEISHGEEITELKLQNEREEFLESSQDVIAEESKAGILNEKDDDSGILEEDGAFQNTEETVEKETEEGNEDTDGSKVNNVSASEDVKLAAKICDANLSVEDEEVEEKSVATEMELERNKFHGLDSVENLGKYTSDNTEEEMKDNIEVHRDKTACLNEDIEKHITIAEHTTTDISPQPAGEETDLIYKGEEEEEKPQAEMHEEHELTSIVEDTEKQELEEVDIVKDQYTEPAIVTLDDMTVTVPKTEMHEIIQIAKEDGNTGKQIMEESSVTKDILEVPQRGINEGGEPEKAKEDENDTIKSKDEIEGIESEFREEIDARGYELAKEVETSQDKQGSDLDLYPAKACEEQKLTKGIEQEDRRQLESSGTDTQEEGLVTVERKGTMVDRVDMNASQDDVSNLDDNKDHEIPTEAGEAEDDIKHEIQDKALIERNDDQNEMIVSETFSGKISDGNLKEHSEFPSNNTELMNSKESKPIDDNSAKDPTASENIEIEWISQVIEPAHDEDKISTAEKISELGIVDAGKVNRDEELHDEQIISTTEDAEILKMETTNQVDQQQICKSETSKDQELSKAGDEALKCIESINEDKEETILDEEGSANKSETSLKENDAAEKATVEHEAGIQIQKVKITETKNYGIPTEEILKSTESSIKLDHTSEIVPSDQSNETIPATSANKLEENGNSESVEQRSQESSEAQQETEEKTDPNMEVEDQIRETQNAEDIKVAILTEKARKEVEKAEGDENIEHINKDENDIKELHSVSIEDERVEEVKEGSPTATEYLKPTDSSEQTETASLAVQDAQNMEKERTILEEKEETKEADEGCEKAAGLLTTTEETEEVITEQIIDDTDISCNKIKATTIVEVKTEPTLEKVQTDEKPLQTSNIPLDARGLHTAEADASQQESIELEENSSNLSSQLPTDDQEKLTSENVALENIAVNDIEESRKASDVIYETKNHDVEELCTGEVGEEINEVSETVYKSHDNETVTEAEVAIDQTLLEEITKQHEAPALAATTENIDKNMEKVVNKKDESPKNSSALKTIEDRSPQPENPREIEVSQLDLQVKKAMPEGPTEEHEEKGRNLDGSKEESEETTETVSQSECYNPEAAIVNEFDDDQTPHNEKAEEQYQIEPCASLSKELELGSLTEIKKIEENIKGEDLLEDEMKTSQEVCLQKEESRELQVSELDLELNEDTKESPNKAEKEAIGTSVEIEEKKEASKSISESNLKGNRAAKEEETNLLQTNTMEKSKEQNQMPSYALVSKEQEGETSAIIGSTDEQTKKEVGVLKRESKAIEEACLQKEEPRELQVSSFEFQLDKDAQESMKEIHQREDGRTDGAREEIKEVSELVLKSSSEDHTKVAEDEINSNQPPSTEKIKEQNRTSSSGLLFEEQGQGTSTTAQSIEEKKTREEVQENAPKTIEKAPLLNKETRELKYAQLKLQPDDDIQKESRKEVHEAEDGTAKEPLKLQPQHENEKGDAAKTDLMATENQGEKPTDATEIMHNEVTNEQTIEEKNDAKNPYAITLGEEATIESHKEHQLIVEETLGARILEKKIQNEVLPEENAKADVSETTEKQISKEKGTVESLHQTFLKKETEKEHFRDETGEKIIQEGRELNNENECDDAISGDGSMKSAYGKGLNEETSRNEGASSLAEAIEVVQDIHQQEKTYDGTLGNQIYRQIKPKTTTSTGKKEVPEVLQEPNVETTKVTEVRELQSAYTTDADSKVQRLEHGVEHEVDNKNGKAIEETVSKDLAKMSLFDMMQRSTRERQAAKELNEEREPMASKEEIKCEKQTEERIKMKSDEEVEEEEEEEEEEEVEEHKKNDSGSDAPVMVEASRDIEIKVVHKKSHNILSGVKSKVKHSIIKVTKAITGKSSHPKHHHG